MIGRDAISRAFTKAIDISRYLRPSLREGERQYFMGMKFRRGAQGWGEEQRSAWVLQRLRETIRYAAATPFYRDRFRDVGFDPMSDFSFADYARLPILERSDVATHRDAMCSDSVSPAQRRKDGTGGSTGVPLVYFSGPEERGWRLAGQDVFMERIGILRSSSTAFLWGHHIDQSERTQWREQVRDTLTNRRWFDCFRLSPDILLEHHKAMTRFDPECLVAYASALDAMAVALLENGLKATYPRRRIVTGGEKLWPNQRERIERVFGVPIHERYGSRELGLVAAQYDPTSSLALDIDWANLFVEPETEGDVSPIIVTKLHADAMPMIRYRVGDQGRFPARTGPGTPVWQLGEVLGRILDGLHTPDGRWVHGIGIPHLMKEIAVREYQIRQNADYSVDILVVPDRNYSEAEGRKILEVLSKNLPGLLLRLQLVDEISRGNSNKWRPVVTHAVPRGAPGVTAPESQ
ncbi:MAG: hypothetical protein U0132_19990 [Gemmatimonadaceae bacterium]